MSQEASSSSAVVVVVVPDSPGIDESDLVKTRSRDLIAQRRHIKYLSAELSNARDRFDDAIAQSAERAAAFGVHISAHAEQFFRGERTDSDRALAESVESFVAQTSIESFIEQNERMANEVVNIGALARSLERATAKLKRLQRKHAQELVNRRAVLLEDFANRHVGLTRERYAEMLSDERVASSKARLEHVQTQLDLMWAKNGSWNLYRSRVEGEMVKDSTVYSTALNVRVKVNLDGKDKITPTGAIMQMTKSLLSTTRATFVAENDEDAGWYSEMKDSFNYERAANELYIAGRSERARHIVQLEQNLAEVDSLAFKVRRLRATLRAGRAVTPTIKTALDDLAAEAGSTLKRALSIAAQTRGWNLNDPKYPVFETYSAASRQRAYDVQIEAVNRSIAQMERYAQREIVNAVVDGE